MEENQIENPEEEFKNLRHRFWKLGRERRLKVIKTLGFDAESWKPTFLDKNEKGQYIQNIEMELVQRKILVHINKFPEIKEDLISLIEVQEAELEKIESEQKTIRVTGQVLGDTAPSKEELEAMKYVPGVKKEV